jgi:hypothetical protein
MPPCVGGDLSTRGKNIKKIASLIQQIGRIFAAFRVSDYLYPLSV